MKHLFIPYELAVLAKQKGFNEPCFGYYNSKELLVFEIEFNYNQRECEVNRNGIQAPMYAQIVDWFRDKHKIDFNIMFRLTNYCVRLSGRYELEAFYGSYYEALNKAIEEAFKLI